ncbi:hypothetical protein K432DRAFT_425876 [Lepidopterella palustris CBS 459.81]|uniref:Peptidase S9 prolyl oligopeptidase catalytic domain-containing protein n=1 Tax=Lepidopterella palustris CBS 459.81 TaxID=1314670 RepID=A0A8E2EAN7_9PEZI|nr:hypothetical protein K432DRAFT_425876 [Lepidopterella palustris CBS 459.81]
MTFGKCYRLCFWYFFISVIDAIHHGPAMIPLDSQEGIQHPITFTSTWQILGPFQIGTREATWGSDPLEFFGGFRNLQYDEETHYRSSIGTNGTVKWALFESKSTKSNSSGSDVSLSVTFPKVDWTFLQSVYGWAALQYQAWARGEITVTADEPQTVLLYTDYILEYWIDDNHYFGGDFYGFRKAPLVIRLQPGSHRIDIRLVRDVRSMGGVGTPEINVELALRLVSGSLELAKDGILIADVVDGRLASPLASVVVRNTGGEDVTILGVEAMNDSVSASTIDPGFVVSAGQTRPVIFTVSLHEAHSSSVEIAIRYERTGGVGGISFLTVSQALTRRSIYSPHKITHLHPNFIVSYAILRPPWRNATCHPGKNSSLPVLLQLHGAGLEADDDLVAHALDPIPDLCAWVLFPAGVTPWSGDDWHSWGFADVEHAVHFIPSWIEAVDWQGPGVNLNRWLISGHSNGGQGTWYALTHRPSNVIAAAPVSGYTSIQKYVPYEFWQPIDPRRSAILSGSLNSYRHEMLIDNCRGIPILQQHGRADDNVPTYHSRFLSQLLLQANVSSQYYELRDEGHWFDGVMTTTHLREFYQEQVANNVEIDDNLQTFSLVVATPGDMGPKGGIRVTQLEIPGQYGRIDVIFNATSGAYALKTSNVMSFEIHYRFLRSSSVVVDDREMRSQLPDGNSPLIDHGQISLQRALDGVWEVHDVMNPGVIHRSGRQLGSLDAILRVLGHFTIRHQSAETFEIALQVSRNLFQYFSADSAIINSSLTGDYGTGNIITIGIGEHLHPSAHSRFPIEVTASSLLIRDCEGSEKVYEGEDGLSAIFLRPLNDERLELVIWGVDKRSLQLAARLVPMLTGVGQPDFVVMRRSCLWKGAEGAVAMGFFDHSWNVSKSSLIG